MNNNIAVFTTKYVLEEKSVITSVVHDFEGAWQFFGREDDTRNEIARIVTLDEILKMDPSLEEILWIPEGTEAWRKAIGDEWTTGVYSS
jgi:hypothetical protein